MVPTMIQFACACGRKLQAREEDAGREAECPVCGRRQVVPNFEAVVVEPEFGPTAVRPASSAIQTENESPRPGSGCDRPAVTSGKGIAVLVLGIASLFLGPLTMIPAVILAVRALRKVRQGRRQVGGAFMHTNGLVLGLVLSLLCTLAWCIGLMIPVTGKVREAAARTQSANNLKQIALAMHAYHDAYGRLPTAAIYSRKGQPLLSWRVTILPFIGENSLYEQFRLDEPWDSPNNKPLLAAIPWVYRFPKEIGLPHDHTIYRVFDGPGAAFEGRQRFRLADFTNGTGNTLLVVEADQGVPWTKPAELPFNPNQPVPPIQGHWASGFQAALADGTVRLIHRTVNERTLREAIKRGDGGLGDDVPW
jgi:DNA-directed RNA polymerase subunit RPC12/RpoP